MWPRLGPGIPHDGLASHHPAYILTYGNATGSTSYTTPFFSPFFHSSLGYLYIYHLPIHQMRCMYGTSRDGSRDAMEGLGGGGRKASWVSSMLPWGAA